MCGLAQNSRLAQQKKLLRIVVDGVGNAEVAVAIPVAVARLRL
jgi:hypothetical protein